MRPLQLTPLFVTKPMKIMRGAALASMLALSTGCKDFLDVNQNPNAPQEVSANLYLAPMLHWLVSGPQFDGRFVARYTQQWVAMSTSLSNWDRMGYDPSSDNGAQQWRDVYWSFGQNLVDMNTKAEAEERWDLLGVGVLLKAWGWLALTGLHGEIIVKEAINQNTFSFGYDTQEYAYQEVFTLLDSAIVLLQRNDGAVDVGYLARGDRIYNGDRTKWVKFAYGMKAMALNHFSNKATYKPADVIAAVNLSFTSNTDDALLTYPNTNNDDINFWGRTRANMTATASATNGPFRQTQFAVNLMNGTQFGGVIDPRMSRILAPSPDGQFRGLDVNTVGFGALTATQQPNNFHGFAGTGGVGVPGRYLFDDKAKVPAMTYAQLQFIKAEAALRMGDQGTALTAYRNGITAHIGFVNARNSDNNQQPTQISATETSTFLGSPAIVPPVLTLSHVMSQKWIAQFGWGHNEMWMDMRRYHYTDIDPVSGTQVFRGFTPPTTLHADNAGKLVQRIRPRFNSEYVWNRPGLEVIGGLATDYHTKPLWITQP